VAHTVVARDFVDVCELLILDPMVLDQLDGLTPGGGTTTAPIVVEDKFHARADLRGGLVLEIDALDRGERPRTELRLRAVSLRPSFRSILNGGRSRRMGTFVHLSVQQIARRIDGALNQSQQVEHFWRHPVEKWIGELRARGRPHEP
jgi:hypothetical protein